MTLATHGEKKCRRMQDQRDQFQQAICQSRIATRSNPVMSANWTNSEIASIRAVSVSRRVRIGAPNRNQAWRERAFARPSMWVLMARNIEDFHGLQADDPHWKIMESKKEFQVWTDNYSNILETLF